LGNQDKALELHTIALNGFIKTKGENHSKVVEAYNSLAETYQAQGNLSEALNYYNKALKVQTKLSGHETVDVLPLHVSIGMLYLQSKRFTHAYEHLEVAHKILKQYLGENDSTVKELKSTLDALIEMNLVKKK
jgi:tetratricopeptide (TPR) repeat protein